jgi:ATP-dependent helicase YprA (DUF1998 family)
MTEITTYSARAVFEGMKHKLHQYLEAQYHIWDESLIAERNSLLEKEGVTFQEPRLEATPFYAPGKPYVELEIPAAAKSILTIASAHRITGIPETPYHHQAESIERFLGQDGSEIIVATGTGSGKTESFLMPILGAMAIEAADRPDSWQQPGCRALLLYPMNALVNDQISRLRRLLGQTDVAERLRGTRDFRATFGMYTSRTPYPGEETAAKNESRLNSLVQNAFLNLPEDAVKRLKAEGKWPAKDLEQFISSSFTTFQDDSEMLSRQEMQHRCPDILVTNYSMLEYMLLRPIERSIFDQTAAWLADERNYLTVVLDEAHMYRGSGGAEVAYLLRRLHARLGVPRSRVKYILTSASLGSSPEARARMKSFAADLSGHEEGSKEFVLITGQQQLKPKEQMATPAETWALANYDFATLHKGESNVAEATDEFRRLGAALGFKCQADLSSLPLLQDAVFQWLQAFGPAALVANKITSKPQQLRDVGPLVFPDPSQEGKALESLLALMSFAKEKDTGRVFAPVRSHMFFRGLPGVYACVNPECNARETRGRGILGKLYSTPRLKCDCGSRVYEVLTHRDCGAAFIRAYVRNEFGDFLWHQPTTGLWGEGGIREAHFLVEMNRRAVDGSGRHEGSSNWLHKTTGRLSSERPAQDVIGQYLELLRPDGLVPIAGQLALSFKNQCPVCKSNWRPGSTKIMDLATKGEAPFAQLVRTQVELQPQTLQPTDQSPNGGRKSLLFSDGRQKAARLARDIPREIESDVFRQLLVLATKALLDIGREPTLGRLYVSMLHVSAGHSLILFDGADRKKWLQDAAEHRNYHGGDLGEALDEPPPTSPASFNSQLLRHLGSPFYSVSALTLARLVPAKKALSQIIVALPEVSALDLNRVLAIWIQSFANEYAVDANLRGGVRAKAAGYPVSGGLKITAGLNREAQEFLRERVPDIDKILDVLTQVLCQTSAEYSGHFIDPKKLSLDLATDAHSWHQCSHCATVSPVEWWGCCPACLAPGVTPVKPGATDYLRARKAFFRDPVIDVLEGRARPFYLSVEEHTAQLSYRDVDDSSTTTEDFERRFRDILVRPDDTSIDVLSSTTTMEVGIDIGSLVGVGLRNVPPLRQNYQQRAGRTGRRGSAVSTVVTYAQNSPHDNHYFENPEPIIAGEPTLPGIDITNPKIIERHIRAQLIQGFFHFEAPIPGGSDIFSVLGKTTDFYNGTEDFSLLAFEEWVRASDSAKSIYLAVQKWVPPTFLKSPTEVGDEFLTELRRIAPGSEDELDASEQSLIEFLFSRGFLPSYAFPRDLCALQIEGPPIRTGGYCKVNVIQRPQQGLNVALSEYAPGRFVVVDKKTYRVGTVAASGSSNIESRAARLFSDRRYYVYCPSCQYTPGFRQNQPEQEDCPLCGLARLRARSVIVPQVVFPDGGREVDEHDDEQVFTNATSAQLSVPEGASAFSWEPLGKNGQVAFARNQQLVMVNKGEEENGEHDGFLVCNQCGKTAIDPDNLGPHKRDYHVSGRNSGNVRCNGQYEPVYLGYGFNSDALLLRIPIVDSLRFHPVTKTEKAPISDAVQSLAEAIVLAIGRELDIDIREINAGHRFLRIGDDHFVDIFVYDTLSGGAGYATQAGESIHAVIERVEQLLGGCDCSSSCNKCLRHYGNRFHHAALDRYLALDLLRMVRDGDPPSKPTVEEQRVALSPLSDMLRLAGWEVTYTENAPVTASNSIGRAITLYSYPSIVQPAQYGFEPAGNTFAFSPYELSRDLPGVFGVIA